MGAGDSAAIAQHGVSMFTNMPEGLKGGQVLEALIATACAQVAQGQPADARELLGVYLPMLQSAGQYTFALRLVNALAGTP